MPYFTRSNECKYICTRYRMIISSTLLIVGVYDWMNEASDVTSFHIWYSYLALFIDRWLFVNLICIWFLMWRKSVFVWFWKKNFAGVLLCFCNISSPVIILHLYIFTSGCNIILMRACFQVILGIMRLFTFKYVYMFRLLFFNRRIATLNA